MPGTRKIRVHRTALVGTVNNGTILADVKHWNDLVDTLSTVLNTVGIAVGDTVDLVLSFVRQIAVAAYPQLRGLAVHGPVRDVPDDAQRPAARRRTSTSRSRRTTSRPTASSSRSSGTSSRDEIFGEKPNDSMVRIDSVVGSTESGEFGTVDEQLLLDETKGVEHSGYFGTPEVADRLVTWLDAGCAVRRPARTTTPSSASGSSAARDPGHYRRRGERARRRRSRAASTVPFTRHGARELRPARSAGRGAASGGSSRRRCELAEGFGGATVRGAHAGQDRRAVPSRRQRGAGRPARGCGSRCR